MRSTSLVSVSFALLAGCSSAYSAGQAPGDDSSSSGASDAGPDVRVVTLPSSDAGGASTGDAGKSEPGDAASDGATHDGGSDGAAASSCADGGIECDQACVPSDVHNCGACGHDCTGLPHVSGAPTCNAGACDFGATSCASGWADCDGNPDNGCETDVTSPEHCGACGTTCPATDPVCAGGTCVSGCSGATPTLCGGTCVDTTSNAGDCGGCGTSCPGTVANAQPTCASSACSFTCNSGYSACPPGSPTSCVNEKDDPENCGACGNACPGPASGSGHATCAAGACGLACDVGLTACGTGAAAECANTASDTGNCGACGNACTDAVANSTATCASGQCGFACNTGFLACSGACIPGADTVNGAFVSPSGGGSACTAAQPCATIAAALATGKSVVYLDKGTYTEAVTLPASNVTIHGGWTFTAGAPWSNCGATSASSVIVAPAGSNVTVSGSAGATWTMDTVTINSASTPAVVTNQPGVSLIGVYVAASTLTLSNAALNIAAGSAGASGSTGAPGSAAPSSCPAGPEVSGPTPSGAAGSTSTQGGGLAPYGLSGNGTAGQGAAGTGGQPGANGGAPGPDTRNFKNGCGSQPGVPGCSSVQYAGNLGIGGCGGGGGTAGGGGWGGGSSVGVEVLADANVTLTNITVNTAAGGQGGQGGAGGAGASPSAGATGVPTTYPTVCAPTSSGGCGTISKGPLAGGTPGSAGGAGGAGGAGAGGGGGDSLCYIADTTGGGAKISVSAVTCNAGTVGVGGLDGNGSTAGQGTSGRSGFRN